MEKARISCLNCKSEIALSGLKVHLKSDKCFLANYKDKAFVSIYKVNQEEQKFETGECYVCMESNQDLTNTCGNQNHKVCRLCYKKCNTCPMCRGKITKDLTVDKNIRTTKAQQSILVVFIQKFCNLMEKDKNYMVTYKEIWEVYNDMEEKDDLELNGRLITDIVNNPFRPHNLLKIQELLEKVFSAIVTIKQIKQLILKTYLAQVSQICVLKSGIE